MYQAARINSPFKNQVRLDTVAHAAASCMMMVAVADPSTTVNAMAAGTARSVVGIALLHAVASQRLTYLVVQPSLPMTVRSRDPRTHALRVCTCPPDRRPPKLYVHRSLSPVPCPHVHISGSVNAAVAFMQIIHLDLAAFLTRCTRRRSQTSPRCTTHTLPPSRTGKPRRSRSWQRPRSPMPRYGSASMRRAIDDGGTCVHGSRAGLDLLQVTVKVARGTVSGPAVDPANVTLDKCHDGPGVPPPTQVPPSPPHHMHTLH